MSNNLISSADNTNSTKNPKDYIMEPIKEQSCLDRLYDEYSPKCK